jgi:hypothetical protein
VQASPFEPTEHSRPQVPAAPAVTPEPVASPVRAREEASLIERASQARTEAAPATAQRFELPPDMEMIETSPVAQRVSQDAEAAQEPARPRRPRTAPDAAPEVPLEQIETRK